MGSHAVVLHSGGLDSTLCLHLALEECESVMALFIDYGQKNRQELLAHQQIAAWYGNRGFNVQRHTVDVSNVFRMSSSELHASHPNLAKWTSDDLQRQNANDASRDGEVTTAVEYRNGVFIAVAASVALQTGRDRVFCGVTGQGASQYYDCSPNFLEAQCEAVYAGTGGKVDLDCPLGKVDKLYIARKIRELGTTYPLHLAWSCYDGGANPCGECLSCVERRDAFRAVDNEATV